MKVFIVDITDEVIQKALDEFKEFGFEASGKACNISDEASVAEVVKACKDAFGPAYALVNCAGIYKDCYFKDMDFKKLKKLSTDIDEDLLDDIQSFYENNYGSYDIVLDTVKFEIDEDSLDIDDDMEFEFLDIDK